MKRIDNIQEQLPDYSMSQNTSNSTKDCHYTVQVLKSTEISPGLISAWDELEARAIVPNAFLSPHFVMPALRYLETSDDFFGVFVEKSSGGLPNLVGVALFQLRKPTRRFPLKHLTTFTSVHSYLSGFLLDREHAHSALQEIYRYLTDQRHAWHGLYINNCPADSILTEEAQTIAAGFGMRWNAFEQWTRAVFFPQKLGQDPLAHLSKRQKKNYLRNLRKLQEIGSVEWEVQRGTQSLQKSIDEFIRLEHLGWKGEEGTSLYANANHARFFDEMMTEFNKKGRAFFTELRLNGKTISSTSNLISGNIGFGFKVGWDIEYAKYGPGTVNELKTLEHGLASLADIEYMDSSSAPDSYINSLWPGRRDIYEGMFCLSPAGHITLTSYNIAQRLKSALFRRKPEIPTENDGQIPL